MMTANGDAAVGGGPSGPPRREVGGGGLAGEGGEGGPRGYVVRVEGFEGPFDLLLELIAQRKLDVSSVDLADVTADFLANLQRLPPEEIDLETATHFLVVAATIVELKAARVLPPDERGAYEELLSEARDLIYARLLEFRAFRSVSAMIRRRMEENGVYRGRCVPVEQAFRSVPQDTRIDVDPRDFAHLAGRVLAPRRTDVVPLHHVYAEGLTVGQAEARIRGRLGRGERRRFRDLVAGLSLGGRVVHFLALLELYKKGEVGLEQAETLAELWVTVCEGGGDPSPRGPQGAGVVPGTDRTFE